MRDHRKPTREFVTYLDDVVRDSREQDSIPLELAEAARSATHRGMKRRVPRELEPADQQRVRAYFWRVVRQRSVRATGAGAREFQQRAIVESIVRDLRESGRDATDIVRELERSLVDTASSALIDEYRQALCG